MRSIRLYIFDMGGVVSVNSDVFSRIADHLGLPLDEFYRMADSYAMHLMTGEITERSFWQHIGRSSDRRISENLFGSYFHPTLNQKVVQKVLKLKEKARVVVGTNTIESHYRIHRMKGDYEPFDAVYASQRMGVAKPDPMFYRKILKAEKSAPSETVFIDDMEMNVEAARALGIHAILFTGDAELEKQLAMFP
jgi:putative hydrolase of the HAD superfamily